MLTLAPWGPSADNEPLKIAVQDKDDQSPFSIAVLRGHHDVARGIVQIAFAQYEPDSQEQARYRLGGSPSENSDNDSDEDCESESSNVPVLKEIVDDKFTIDNIGDVATQVRSKTSPLTMMSWNCWAWGYFKFCTDESTRKVKHNKGSAQLMEWAIATNDKDLFSFLADLDIEWKNRLTLDDEGLPALPTLHDDHFKLAIELGRLDILAELIRRYGAGMDIQSLVKQSGVKFQEKPKFYQGLSVRLRITYLTCYLY